MTTAEKAQSEAYRKREAARKRKERASATDIGAIDKIDNVERRESCKEDFGKFCKTYLPEVFELNWSQSHLIAIRRIEEAVLVGGNFAFAMPRGSGKSSLSRAAVLWAILYNHSRYTYLIGANSAKAEDALDTIKVWLRYVEPILEDFPEVCQAIVSLNGVAQRASSQRCEGMPTEIEWTRNRVALPSNSMAPNDPNFEDGKLAVTAGAVIGVSGLDGSGIRGSTFTTTTGNIVRPDLVIIDDPQTDESARSLSQIESRLDLINGAVLKMAGPGVKMRGVIPCTIIKRDDLAHRVLDKKESPFWRGETTRLMPTMPSNMEAWDQYFSIYEQCLLADTLDMTPANDHYLEHQESLEEGASHSWPERKNPDEVTAIQNAMNLYYQDKSSFMAEMQNDPIDTAASLLLLSVEELQNKQAITDRYMVPDESAFLVAHIDVHKNILYYSVLAVSQNFTGTFIDYGTFPEQNRRIFGHRDIKKTLADVIHYESEEEQIYFGLQALSGQLRNEGWHKADGSRLSLSKGLIDCGYQRSTVENFCRDDNTVFTPMQGMGVRATQKILTDTAARDTLISGHHWLVRPSAKFKTVQWCLADVNFWKTFLHERFVVGQGGAGSFDLFRETPRTHEMFASQLRSETYDDVFSDKTGRRVKEWSLTPNQDNHYFDTAVGCCVAASMVGCSLEHVDMAAIADKKIKIKRTSYGQQADKNNRRIPNR